MNSNGSYKPCGKCKACVGKSKFKCERTKRLQTGGSAAKQPVRRRSSRESITFKPQVPIYTSKQNKPHIRDRRSSTSNASYSSHNTHAGDVFSVKIEKQQVFEAKELQSVARKRQREQDQLSKEQAQQKRLKSLNRNDSDESGESSDEEVESVSSLDRLLTIAEFLDIDPEKLHDLERLKDHAGTKATSAEALTGKRTGINLGSILTELLKLMLESITIGEGGENNVGVLFSLMVQCSTFQKEILGESDTTINIASTTNNSLRILKESIRDGWRQSKRENDEIRATELLSLLTSACANNKEIKNLLDDVLVIEKSSSVLIGEVEEGARTNVQYNKNRIGTVTRCYSDGTFDVKKKTGGTIKRVKLKMLRHINTIIVTDQKITIAKQHRKEFGPGGTTPSNKDVEYKTVTMNQLTQFIDWVMQDHISSVCKMSARNLKAGHMRFLRHKIRKNIYDKHYATNVADALSWKTYQFLLKNAIFVVQGADTCQCPQCHTHGFRAMGLRGPALFDLIASVLGEHRVKHLRKRLGWLHSFITTERPHHIELESHDANHCAKHLCGSGVDGRFDTSCKHGKVVPDDRPQPGPQELWSKMGGRIGTNMHTAALHPTCDCENEDGTRKKYHKNCIPQRNSECEICNHEPVGSADKMKRMGARMAACQYCQLVACNGTSGKACAKQITGGGARGIEETKNGVFTCQGCQEDIDLDQHSNICGLCEETHFFQADLKDTCRRACNHSFYPEEDSATGWKRFLLEDEEEVVAVEENHQFEDGERVAVWWEDTSRYWLGRLLQRTDSLATTTSSSSSSPTSTSSSTSTLSAQNILWDVQYDDPREEDVVSILLERLAKPQFVQVLEPRKSNWRGVVINTEEDKAKPYQVAMVDTDGIETMYDKAWWYSSSHLIFEDEMEEAEDEDEDAMDISSDEEEEEELNIPTPATVPQRIIKYTKDLLKSINYLDRHMGRVGMMSRYKPNVLSIIKKYKLYHIFYIISDFWKKFTGIAMANANCANDASTSVEGHVIVFLKPPDGLPNVLKESFDYTCEDIGDGFCVLYLTLASQDTTQDWVQMMCNRVVISRFMKELCPYMTGCFSQSDGAYNTTDMALQLALLGKMTGIYWLTNAFTEAGHGGERVDSTGACSIHHIWPWTRIEGNGPIDNKNQLGKALDDPPLKGHATRLIDHDPTTFDSVASTGPFKKAYTIKESYIKQGKAGKQNTTIKAKIKKYNIALRDCLYRLYPVRGLLPTELVSEEILNKYDGGVIFYRFIGELLSGIGSGVGFTAAELHAMRGGNTLDNSVVVVSEKSGVRTVPETCTKDLSKQDRADERQRISEVRAQRDAKKAELANRNRKFQRESAGTNMKEDRLRELETARMANRNNNAVNNNNNNNEHEDESGDGSDDDDAMEIVEEKLTRTEALQQVIYCVTENFESRRVAATKLVSLVDSINTVILNRALVESDDCVTENDRITSIGPASKLWDYGVLGWDIVLDDSISQDKIKLRRQTMKKVPLRGYSNRPHEPNKKKNPSQLAFLKKNAEKKPKNVNAARLSKLSITQCGELNMLEPEQIKSHAASWFARRNAMLEKALRRKGMPCYDDLSVVDLRTECEKRKIKFHGQARVMGLSKLLEDDDDKKKKEELQNSIDESDEDESSENSESSESSDDSDSN